MPRQFISPKRKFFYYAGMTLAVIGVLSFLSVFVSVIFYELKGDSFGMHNNRTFPLRAFGGMILIMIGFVLMQLGWAGLAGSGVVLDPKRARRDLEPWTRMKGGMIKDALDEAGIDLGQRRDDGSVGAQLPLPPRSAGSAPLPFDEQLRRLHALYTDGIISETEYETKKRQILKNS